MTANRTSVRRIMVALDASPASMSALHNAVELAARLDAELTGLFVEDINLLRVAQLPFAREISFFSPALRQLTSIELELQLRAQAARIRETMALMADPRGVRWRFHITRGSVAAEVLAAGTEADLMILGKIGRSFAGLRHTGSTVRMVVMQRRGLTLILQTALPMTMPIIVIYSGAQLGAMALEAASHLVQARDGRLTVFVLADDKEQARTRQMEVMERLQVHELGADFRLLIRPSLSGLAARIRMESAGPVVIPCDGDGFAGEQVCSLVEEVVNPVLLVR